MKAQIAIVAYQIIFILVVVMIIKSIYLELDIQGAFYGGLITVIASIIMACRVTQAVKKSCEGSQRGILYLYLGVIERLFIAIALFTIGFMWLKFNPVPMVIGLISGQVGFMLGGFRVKD